MREGRARRGEWKARNEGGRKGGWRVERGLERVDIGIVPETTAAVYPPPELPGTAQEVLARTVLTWTKECVCCQCLHTISSRV
jgi:hypothetical protein